MFRPFQLGLVLVATLAVLLCSAHGEASAFRVNLAPSGSNPSGFPELTVTLSRTLISDDGYLIADFAKRYGIRTIYLPIAGPDINNLLRRNRATVDNLNALFAACKVYMVAGSDAWLAHPGTVPAEAQLLSQRVGPMYPKFAGILYDIEPQKFPEWDKNRQQAIDRYFTLLDTLFAPRNPSTFRETIVSTIAAFARQPNRSGGRSPSMLQAIEAYRAVDGTYLLMPGNSAGSQLERAKAAFPQMRKPYLAVANTAPNAGGNGYSGSTPQYLYNNLEKLDIGARFANSLVRGVAVSSWDDRFASLQSILPQPTPPPIPQPTGPLVPRNGTDYIGAYVAPNGDGPNAATIAAFEKQIGRTLAYDIHYVGWNKSFPGHNESDDVEHDRIPLLSWHCGDSNARIAAGKDDALIRERAKAFREFGHPVFLRYEWEMNLSARTESRKGCYDSKTDLPSGFFSPAKYRAAWRRMHAIFKAEGVTNVVWLWNPGASAADPSEYYPGDDQVDWIGLDSYDRQNESFEDTFFPYLDVLSQFKKPMIVVESGARLTFQTAYFQTALDTLKIRYPLVRGFSYLNARSWSLETKGIAAFARLANSPFMSARQPH